MSFVALSLWESCRVTMIGGENTLVPVGSLLAMKERRYLGGTS